MNNYKKRKRKFKKRRMMINKFWRKQMYDLLTNLYSSDSIKNSIYIPLQPLRSFKHIDYSKHFKYSDDIKNANKEIIESRIKLVKKVNRNRQFHSIDEFVTEMEI
jgi:hypothetical protein